MNFKFLSPVYSQVVSSFVLFVLFVVFLFVVFFCAGKRNRLSRQIQARESLPRQPGVSA